MCENDTRCTEIQHGMNANIARLLRQPLFPRPIGMYGAAAITSNGLGHGQQ